MSAPKTVTAALIIIGNEILSGRTIDKNLPFLATRLNEIGVQLRECRVVPDVEDEIVRASIFSPPASIGSSSRTIACMIFGTPGRTWTFSTRKPGATETGLSISSTPSGMSAIDIRSSLTRSGG